MKLIQLFSYLAAVSSLVPLMAQTNQAKLTRSPRAARVIQVQADSQTSAAEIRQVDVSDANGHQGALVLIHEPSSKLYWWAWRATAADDTSDVLDPFLAKLRIQVSGGHLYVFGFAGRSLEVREESGRATTLTEAQDKATAELSTRWTDLRGGKWKGTRFIDLGVALGPDFMYLKDSEAAGHGPTLRSVVRAGAHWVATLDGPNGDSAEVTLDDSFRVLSAEKK